MSSAPGSLTETASAARRAGRGRYDVAMRAAVAPRQPVIFRSDSATKRDTAQSTSGQYVTFAPAPKIIVELPFNEPAHFAQADRHFGGLGFFELRPRQRSLLQRTQISRLMSAHPLGRAPSITVYIITL
jgi:hypothetical protein